MTIKTLLNTNAAAATLCAGAALSWTASALEPPRSPSVQQSDPQSQRPAQQEPAHYHSYRNTIHGTEVRNATGDSIASISDLVIDRGSGEVRWVVVRIGDVLGIGGAQSLLPYYQLNWRLADHTVATSLTEAQLEALPEIDTSDWTNLDWNPFDDDADPDAAQKDGVRHDPYQSAFNQPEEPTRIEGRIVSVDRATPGPPDQEYLLVTIQPVRGEATQVVFGPSWYVMGHEAAPARGQRVTVSAVPDPRGSNLLVATDAEIEGRSLRLRDREGAPLWGSTAATPEYGGAPHPYVFASTLMGAPIEALGEAAGEVHDLILDVTSAHIGFVAIDPNDNFLGMLDTIRLAPWQATNYMPSKTMRIDATEAMIKSSPEAPKDMTRLDNFHARERIYQHYDLRPASGQRSSPAPNRDEITQYTAPRGWTSHDDYAKAAKSGERVEYRGTVVAVERTRSFPTVEGPVAILLLRDAAGDIRQLHLGPDSYFQRNPISVKPGDSVVVEARAATIGNQSFVAVHRLQRNGDWIILWNEEGRPTWDTR